jgi:iron-sulfur cluster repair protein YtfE (RIC family)
MKEINLEKKASDCFAALPDLEVPMVKSLVSCLAREHIKLDEQLLQLAIAATRLAADPKDDEANERTTEVWEDIRDYLWSHLQIEDELVLGWGGAHHAIAGTLSETLEKERQEMRKSLTALGSCSNDRGCPADHRRRAGLAIALLALSKTLDAHVERYEGEVLPAIQRALFHP